MTAYHEGGHALITLLTKGVIPLHKVTILPRGGALGFVLLDYFQSFEDIYDSRKRFFELHKIRNFSNDRCVNGWKSSRRNISWDGRNFIWLRV